VILIISKNNPNQILALCLEVLRERKEKQKSKAKYKHHKNHTHTLRKKITINHPQAITCGELERSKFYATLIVSEYLTFYTK